MGRMDTQTARELLAKRRETREGIIQLEIERLTALLAEMGARLVVLFGSLAKREQGLVSDVDLLVVWETDLDFVERTAEIYRRLCPRVATDILVYTPEEMEAIPQRPFIRKALKEGRVLYEA